MPRSSPLQLGGRQPSTSPGCFSQKLHGLAQRRTSRTPPCIIAREHGDRRSWPSLYPLLWSAAKCASFGTDVQQKKERLSCLQHITLTLTLLSLPSTTGSSAAVDRLFVNRSSSSKLSHMRTTRGRYEFMTRGFIFHPQGIKTRRLGGCRSYLSASMATISIR